ncbi:hypothetical protein AVEN_263504-1 [Araneus ventricosus]|uniref:Uncharacterized protein n=1 Tax=Araneus ventricosus TaxID=182803 RepID=A0A4Y2EYR3_ARAVE|nr:hypothetical protein AVEN_263504-1 [Araneus ventricosus]
MPLRRRRSHYEQLTEFERGRVIGLREGGFSFRDIAERLGRNVSTVHDCWVRWSRDGTASRRPGSGRIFTNPTLIELRQEISQYHWLRGAVTSFSDLARSARQS